MPKSTKPLQPCGTNAAWNRHYLARETACAPCTAAHLIAATRIKAAHDRRQRAMYRVSMAHREEYEAVLAEEEAADEDRARLAALPKRGG